VFKHISCAQQLTLSKPMLMKYNCIMATSGTQLSQVTVMLQLFVEC